MNTYPASVASGWTRVWQSSSCGPVPNSTSPKKRSLFDWKRTNQIPFEGTHPRSVSAFQCFDREQAKGFKTRNTNAAKAKETDLAKGIDLG